MPEIDVDSFRAAFLANLQQTQDYMRACEAGLSVLTEDIYETNQPRGRVLPAPDYVLDLKQARNHGRFVLARSYFRDVIDFSEQYLNHVFEKCAFVKSIVDNNGKPDVESIREPFSEYRRKGLGKKLETVAKKFEVTSEYIPHLLTINRVRNCLVHRLGRVSHEDLAADSPALELRMMRLTILVPPGARGTGIWKAMKIPADRIIPHEVTRTFQLRDHLRFDEQDLNDCAYTMVLFESSMRDSFARYCERCGIEVSRSIGNPRMKDDRTS